MKFSEFQKKRSVPRKSIVKIGESNYDGNLLLKILHEVKKAKIVFECQTSHVRLSFTFPNSSGFFILWPVKAGAETLEIEVKKEVWP